MIPYQVKSTKLTGSNYKEIRNKAVLIFRNDIEKQSKRKPYIKSAYFKKQKIFFDYFWKHTYQKNPRTRFRRLKYFKAGIELIKDSRNEPASKQNPNKRNEVLHRFAGLTKEKELFYVQIKEDKKTGKKYFMSCFPPE